MLRDLRATQRGSALPYAIIGLIAFIFIVTAFLLFPAFFLGGLIAVIGLFVLVVYKAHPYGLGVGFSLIVIAAIIIFLAQGQGLSVSLTHALGH